MKVWPRVDFRKLADGVGQGPVGRSHIAIWGGRCPEDQVEAFFQKWDLSQMPYRIWEYVSEITFGQNTLPQNVALLERGRLFGEGGDLEVRRDGAEFAWRFIGPAGVQPPAGFRAKSYWDRYPEGRFHQQEACALLWGIWDDNKKRWYEDRVGAARLEYPATGSRIRLDYRVFSRAGHVEFVWFTGLVEWKEADRD